ncbi:MAG TPA: cation-translocating P-type ATPase [Chthoniobacterales bacterium]
MLNNNSVESIVARLLARETEVKQLRVDEEARKIDIGFYKPEPADVLERIEKAVRHEFSGDWDISVQPEDASPLFHHHQIDGHTAEFHRAHPPAEPRLIWKHIVLPRWRNRPVPRQVERDYRIMLALAALCGLATLTAFLLPRFAPVPWLLTLLFFTAYLAGGWFSTQDVWRGLKHGKIDVQFLMIVVALGALFVGARVEGVTLLFLFSLSNGLEQFANYRTHRAIDSLLKAAPKHALRRETDSWVEVAVETVRLNDELLVKAGELFPVDGVIIEGATAADESALTGEALPVAKRAGDAVSGGTLNLDGQAIIRVSHGLEQSALHRILDLIRSAQQQKAPAQRFTDAFSQYYTWVVLGMSVAGFIVLLSLHQPLHLAFYRTMTLLVVASPCALVLSIPSAILVAIAAGARQGILFRGGVAIENLAGVTQFAFDKTGTLTKGSLRVTRIRAEAFHSEEAVLQLASSVGRWSTHPLSRALSQEAKRRALPPLPVSEFLNIPGLGMEARVGDEMILVGSRKLMEERKLELPATGSHSEAEVWVANSGILGVIYLSDEVRPAARAVISYLKKTGVAITLMTGDRPAAAQAVAEQVGIVDVRADVSPEEKLQSVHQWRREGKKVAMVGDGINDAPSLTAADVAIGMGARGSDAALEQADVILMHDKIENVEQAVKLSRRARAVIRQNIVISLGVILLLVTSALANKINLTTGVIGHEGSTVIVVLNGLRLLRSRRN